MVPFRHPLIPLHPTPHSTHVSATAQLRPFDKFDTCQIQTTFLQIRRVSKCRMPPYLARRHRPPKTPSPHHDEIRQPLNPRRPTPMLHICQLRPSYDHATNATLFRYESPFVRYERCSMSIVSPYLGCRHQPSQRSRFTLRRNPPTPCRGTGWSNTSQLQQWNEWNASQIQTVRPQLRTEFHTLSGLAPVALPDLPETASFLLPSPLVS